jgi:hypothetical protein
MPSSKRVTKVVNLEYELLRANENSERGGYAVLTSVLAWQALCPCELAQTQNSYVH